MSSELGMRKERKKYCWKIYRVNLLCWQPRVRYDRGRIHLDI
jgi:hypothetical protein